MAIWSRLLVTGLSAAILAGCVAVQNQVPETAGNGSSRSVADRASKAAGGTKTALLYVVHRGKGFKAHPVVSILSLPQHTELARITGYNLVGGVCSDASGNVWVTGQQRGRWHADKFSPGGTQPTTELNGHGVSLTGCAVDPKSGDLAVVGTNIDGGWRVLIWPGARRGTPAEYSVPLIPTFATYDDHGNLFISGPAGYSISEYYFALAELAKGGTSVMHITLNRPTGHWGPVQWDGTDLVAGTTERHHLEQPRIYRVKVSRTTGDVVGVVRPKGFFGGIYPSSPVFALYDGSLIGVYGNRGEQIREWLYPGGGKSTAPIARFEIITAMAVSQS